MEYLFNIQETNSFFSDYIPFISFPRNSLEKANNFIQNKIENLIVEKGLEKDTLDILGFSNSIVFQDFQSKQNLIKEYFYDKVFKNIQKKDDMVIPKNFIILTYDKNEENTTIKIGEQDFAYFLYINLEELLNYIK